MTRSEEGDEDWNQTDTLFMHLVNKYEFGHSVNNPQLTPLASLPLVIR